METAESSFSNYISTFPTAAWPSDMAASIALILQLLSTPPLTCLLTSLATQCPVHCLGAACISHPHWSDVKLLGFHGMIRSSDVSNKNKCLSADASRRYVDSTRFSMRCTPYIFACAVAFEGLNTGVVTATALQRAISYRHPHIARPLSPVPNRTEYHNNYKIVISSPLWTRHPPVLSQHWAL